MLGLTGVSLVIIYSRDRLEDNKDRREIKTQATMGFERSSYYYLLFNAIVKTERLRKKKRQVVIGKEVFLKVIVYTKEGKVRRKITKDSPFRLYSI